MRLVFYCTDVVGVKMAGPGIRFWELAHALSANHSVTLVAPVMSASSERVRLLRQGDASWRKVLADADVLITQALTPGLILLARLHDVRLVLDAYVPSPVEALEHERGDSPLARRTHAHTILAAQQLGLLAADAVLCANERQRDLWIGSLVALGRLTPRAYDADPTLRSTVAVIPFGLSNDQLERSGPGPREIFGLDPDAFIALWGGGVWEWFDPITVIEAVARVRRRLPHLHLVFMGLRHPRNVGHDDQSVRALRRIEELGLLGAGIHVAESWIPYAERSSWLLDADLGVSANLDLVENRFAFRTRVLDYLWAGLPCLLTAGDSMSELAEADSFGLALPPRDVDAWVVALSRLVSDATLVAEFSAAAREAATRFTWPVIAARLDFVLAGIADRPRPAGSLRQLSATLRWALSGSAAVLIREGATGVLSRLRRAQPSSNS